MLFFWKRFLTKNRVVDTAIFPDSLWDETMHGRQYPVTTSSVYLTNHPLKFLSEINNGLITFRQHHDFLHSINRIWINSKNIICIKEIIHDGQISFTMLSEPNDALFIELSIVKLLISFRLSLEIWNTWYWRLGPSHSPAWCRTFRFTNHFSVVNERSYVTDISWRPKTSFSIDLFGKARPTMFSFQSNYLKTFLNVFTLVVISGMWAWL